MASTVTQSGDSLIMYVDGAKLLFVPTGQNIWLYESGGSLWLEAVGNMLMLTSGEDKVFAYPTNANSWIIDGSVDPEPPVPGTGDFSWPYEPTWLHWVTSEYGPRNGRFHEGIDFSGGPAVYGEPIPAIGDGTIQLAQNFGAFGNCVIINHGNFAGNDRDYHSLYAHMASLPPVSVGNPVSKGDIIGAVNNTGSSFGSHLHMEIHRTTVGGAMKWDNLNPSYNSSRTAINPRNFFTTYGDGAWLIS